VNQELDQTVPKGAKAMFVVGQILLFDLVCGIIDLFWWLR